MAQALERAGDHTTNLAEELYSLIEGHSLRHLPKETGVQLVVGPCGPQSCPETDLSLLYYS